MLDLAHLNCRENSINDLSPLQPVEALTMLSTGTNEIVDITPLLNSAWVNSGDWIDLTGNPVDCEGQLDALQALKDLGVQMELPCEAW